MTQTRTERKLVIKGQLKQKYGQLTDDDLALPGVRRTKLWTDSDPSRQNQRRNPRKSKSKNLKVFDGKEDVVFTTL